MGKLKHIFNINVILHSILWVVVYFSFVMNIMQDDSIVESITYSFIACLIFAPYFYFNYFKLSKLLFEQKVHVYLLLILLMIASGCLIIRFVPWAHWILFVDEDSSNYYIDFINTFLIVTMLSLILSVVRHQNKEIQKKTEMDNAKLNNELKFLKRQIHPHFLFNSLNNIYSLAYTNDEQTAPMISKLSKILRYMLEQDSKKQVKLIDEINFLKDYIDFQSIKLDDPIRVDFYQEGIKEDCEIAPMLLIHFLENCFKHSGIMQTANAWIEMEIVMEDDVIRFVTTNSILENSESATGLGLKNVKKQLDFYYPGKHELSFRKSEKDFRVELKIWR